ncbi:hypothetical protein FPQ18DRAFT_314056 [Pyronema domesticum]|nr:hypothetical protein FPQ18DRAFT_314056 [Pyronema domesticum]
MDLMDSENGEQVYQGQLYSEKDLAQTISRIGNAQYGAYKQLSGPYKWQTGLPLQLFVDHIQGDPYASPSKFRVRISLDALGVPSDVYSTPDRITAYCDYINRNIVQLVKEWRLDIAGASGSYHGPKGGDFNIYRPSQQILNRSSIVVGGLDSSEAYAEIRFMITLPANGRTIAGDKVHALLCKHLPNLIKDGLHWSTQQPDKIYTHLRTFELQNALRNKLSEMNLVAFIGNSSILPRASGADPGPMTKGAVPFTSPKSLEVTIPTNIKDVKGNPISVTGMGIPRGVTVITGGGFHGKSTLLEALQFGIYNTIPNDGRELVVTSPLAFKVRAEDGRSVVGTDISAFITSLPGGKNTTSFSSPDASGSTSMAANIQEALEIGADALIIDEDTSATNFLIRDSKMHELVRSEPITPLVTKVTALFKEKGVSTIIVIGGCGDYLSPAATVIGMESYKAEDWTARAKEIAAKYPNPLTVASSYGSIPERVVTLPELGRKGPMPKGVEKIVFKGDRDRMVDDTDVDIGGLEQLVEEGQSRMAATAMEVMKRHGGDLTIRQWVEKLRELKQKGGTNIEGKNKMGGQTVETRELEILGAVNRVRGLKVAQVSGPGI